MISLLLAVALLDFASGEEVLKPCPPESTVAPCYCVNDTMYHFIVTCERTDDMNEVRRILAATKGWEVGISFQQSNLGNLPEDLFEGQTLDSVAFTYCEVDSFGEKPFSGMEKTLKTIDLFASAKKLETFPLGHLPNLHSVVLQNNGIRHVGNEWFKGDLSKLLYVSLEDNGIEELGDEVFSSLSNIYQLWFSENPIRSISRSMFPNPAPRLAVLEMNYCEIDVIPEDLFTNMPSLNTISVEGNKLLTLPENTWGRVWNNLVMVNVEKNRIVCNNGLRWIFERTLPGTFDGKCYNPKRLRGNPLNELEIDDL